MSNNLLAGKKGIIFGALDEKSIAWKTALAGDPESAFGGVLVCNAAVNKATAEAIKVLNRDMTVSKEMKWTRPRARRGSSSIERAVVIEHTGREAIRRGAGNTSAVRQDKCPGASRSKISVL